MYYYLILKSFKLLLRLIKSYTHNNNLLIIITMVKLTKQQRHLLSHIRKFKTILQL